MKCHWCDIDNGNYDFSNICCRVRFLFTQRNIENRRGWMERWEIKFGNAQSEKVKSQFEKQWKQKREGKCQPTSKQNQLFS